MPLFAVQRAEGDASLVIEAAVVEATDGWWVFRNADDRPVATLPTAAVCAIDGLAAADARGSAWAHAGNNAGRANRLYAKVS